MEGLQRTTVQRTPWLVDAWIAFSERKRGQLETDRVPICLQKRHQMGWDGMGLLNSSSPPRNISTSLSLFVSFLSTNPCCSALMVVVGEPRRRDSRCLGGLAAKRPGARALGNYQLPPYGYPLESNPSDSACCFLFPVSYPAASAVGQATS